MTNPGYFENTTIEKLSLQHDGEWLGWVVPRPAADITQDYVSNLNTHAELSLGGEAVQELLKQIPASSPMFDASPLPQWSRERYHGIKHRAQKEFYKLMAMHEIGSPYHRSNATKVIPPITIIGTTRLLHDVAGDGVALVTELASQNSLFQHATASIERKIRLLQDNGLDVGRILLANSGIFRRSDSDPASFVAFASRAGNVHKKILNEKLTKMDAISSPITLSSTTELQPPVDSPLHGEISQWTGIDQALIRTALPAIDQFDASVLHEFMSQIQTAAEWADDADRQLRLRDILKILQSVQNKKT